MAIRRHNTWCQTGLNRFTSTEVSFGKASIVAVWQRLGDTLPKRFTVISRSTRYGAEHVAGVSSECVGCGLIHRIPLGRQHETTCRILICHKLTTWNTIWYIYIILIYIDIYTLAESDNNGLKQDMIRATVGVAHLFFPWLALHTKHFAHVKPSVWKYRKTTTIGRSSCVFLCFSVEKLQVISEAKIR